MIRDISIRTVLNGYIVTVGCHTLTFNSAEHMLAEIARYLRDSTNVEREYLKNSKNAQHFTEGATSPDAGNAPDIYAGVERASSVFPSELRDRIYARTAEEAYQAGRRDERRAGAYGDQAKQGNSTTVAVNR